MFSFIKRKLKSNKGAMDSILVTLLLIIIGVSAVVGLKSWLVDRTAQLTSDANQTLTDIVRE